MDALMRSYGSVAGRLNDILKLFEKHIDGATELMIDLSWAEAFEDLGSWQNAVRMIPPQAGNEGKLKHANAPSAATAAKTQVVEAPAKVQALAAPTPREEAIEEADKPEAQPMAVAAPTHGQGGYFASLASAPPIAQPQPMYPPGYYPPGYYPPQPGMYPQQPMQFVPTENLVNEDGKVNFRAALAASGMNPAFIQAQLPPELQAREMHDRMVAQGVQPMQYPYGGQPGYPMGGGYPQQPQQRAGYSTGYAAPPQPGYPAAGGGMYVPTASF
jgi:hypothetical protein